MTFNNRACHLCPTRFRIGVLFKTTNCVPSENENHFPQMALGAQSNGVSLCPKLDDAGVLDENVLPDLNDCLLERGVHVGFEKM
jgi:hypothetical protein